MCNTPERDFIKELINERKESICFFSNKCKSEREVWVVRHFLSQLRIEFSDEEITPSQNEPVDVIYSDARFQVKEILDENRRRGDEYRESLLKAENATSPSDLLEHYQPNMITCADIVPIVAKKAFELQQKYGPSERISIDLLFYLNLQDIHVVGDIFPDVDCYSSIMAGWRSVSVDSGDCALVLHVSQRAPSFMKTSKGKVHRNLSFWLDE